MAKTKHHKYERVKKLPNVIIPDPTISPSLIDYPWNDINYGNMEKILELGCGKGEHSFGFARANPGRLYVGVDCKSHRLCVGGEQAIDHGLGNLFFLRAQVEEIRTFFLDQSITEIWLTSPDPHPKQRAIKHRLTAALFLDVYARLLVPGGQVHLKTDNDLLYTYTGESVEYWGGKVLTSSGDLHGDPESDFGAQTIVSAFEAKAIARAETIKYLSFTLN